MLGRTANGLFWMSRYLERAENIARLIDAGFRMSLTRSVATDEDWDGVLQSAGVRELYAEKCSTVTAADAMDFLLRDKSNPSSVLNCIEFGRNNARMVRTALTRESWETINESWLQIKNLLAKNITQTNLTDCIEAIKRRCALMRGAFSGTQLRDELYNFAMLGSFVERADNTARILDVKYYVLLPSLLHVGSTLDNFHWQSILRSVSALRSYLWVYDAEYKPANIAHFLILNRRMPRSLAFCYETINSNLAHLARDYGAQIAAHDTAARTRNMLLTTSIDAVMQNGLHEFLEDFILANDKLASEITEGYRFYK
ncbi:alpha-E domain-containing protein [Rhizobium sp. KVB221]|uniref:Alpha-E domain-containing protein n=1 Tax=Rhizobium setariae TaxID=2801340 RepID=A0A936YTF3_9HYPH|nr:alpha-E domain-containing protein [Rhizobium setariae]MBL0372120.1 alpha-E domain-containing protein [Rhizobium setariae]